MKFEIWKDYQVEWQDAVYRYVYSSGLWEKIFKWISDPTQAKNKIMVSSDDVAWLKKMNPQTGDISSFEVPKQETTESAIIDKEEKDVAVQFPDLSGKIYWLTYNIDRKPDWSSVITIHDWTTRLANKVLLGESWESISQDKLKAIIANDNSTKSRLNQLYNYNWKITEWMEEMIKDWYLVAEDLIKMGRRWSEDQVKNLKEKLERQWIVALPSEPTPIPSDKPENWDKMSVDEKANYIKTAWITDLTEKDWWANDKDKEKIWDKMQTTDEPTPTQDDGEPTPTQDGDTSTPTQDWEVAPTWWYEMTPSQKAQTLIEWGYTDLANREWWANDENKVAIYEFVKEFKNITPEELAQKFAGQTNLGQDPEWIKYPQALKEQAFAIMEKKTSKEALEEKIEGRLTEEQQEIEASKQKLLDISEKVLASVDVYKSQQEDILKQNYTQWLQAIQSMTGVSQDQKRQMYESLQKIKANKEDTLNKMMGTISEKYSARKNILESMMWGRRASTENILRSKGIDISNPLALQNMFAKQDINYENQLAEIDAQQISELNTLTQELGNIVTEELTGQMTADTNLNNALIQYQQALTDIAGKKASAESWLGTQIFNLRKGEDEFAKSLETPELSQSIQQKANLQIEQKWLLQSEVAKQEQLAAEKRSEAAQKRLIATQAAYAPKETSIEDALTKAGVTLWQSTPAVTPVGDQWLTDEQKKEIIRNM